MDLYHVYADESRQTQSRFMLFGALLLQRGDPENAFLADVAAYRAEHHLKAEMKWGKVSRGMLPIYEGYVDLFFRSSAQFCCLAVDKHRIDYAAYHQNNRETAFYFFYCMMLSRNLDPARRYLIYTDERNNRERNRLSDLKACINDHWAGQGVVEDVVRNVEPRVSKECEPLQMVDILLGAVGYDIEEYTTSEPRVALVDHIAGKIGASQLKDHRARGMDFNVWMFDFDQTNKKAENRPGP